VSIVHSAYSKNDLNRGEEGGCCYVTSTTLTSGEEREAVATSPVLP
jgi:hypothetical protein